MNTPLPLQHLDLIASAPEGVKRLRELILELAVRGKLVPQDPNDEPASELLKRIQAEKARLVAEGRIKKDKPLPEIGEEEKPFELPEGWEWARLQTCFDVRDGTHDTPKYQPSGFPLVTSKNIYGGRLCLEDVKFISEVDHRKISERSRVDRGDILFAMIGSIGNPVVINIDPDFSIKNVALFKYYARHMSNPEYLRMYLEVISGDFKVKSAGGVQSFVSLGFIRSYVFPLPPLAEQHRIVAKVDELMALCDRLEAQQTDAASAHTTLVKTLLETLTQSQASADFTTNWQRFAQHFDTLFTTEASITALKQTLLQLAVMGKLVPQDPSDEPASELLKRIQAEKARLIAEGKIKKDKPLPEIGEEEKQFELPEGWEWVRFDSVVSCRLGKMLDKAKNRGLLKPYLRNTNVQWWRFELDDIKEIQLDESEFEEFRVLAGDLLICEGGEPGRCAIWRGEREEIYFQKALHRARPLCGVMPDYLQFCLRSDTTSGVLDQYLTGSTIKHFPGEKLSRYLVPMPPAAEQHRIVAKVDELMALCDHLASRLKAARELSATFATAATEAVLEAA